MLPPPAPTSAMSIVGIRRSSPAPRISRLPAEIEPPTSYSRPREMAPFSISDALAVVPPMSKAIAFSIPSRLRHAERRDDACRRPRLEREHGPQLRVVGGHHAAGRLHDRERCALQPDPVEAGADAVDVRRHQRPHVGVDHRRRRALVLALLAQDLARERDRRLGELLREDLADALLVLGVEVGVEEADGDRVDAELPQAGGRAPAPRRRRAPSRRCRRQPSARRPRSAGAARRGAAASPRRGRTCAGSAAGAARGRRGSARS